MWSLVGVNNVFKTLCTLTHGQLENKKTVTIQILKKAITDYLIKHNPHITYSNSLKPCIIQSGHQLIEIIKILDLEKEIRSHNENNLEAVNKSNLNKLNAAMKSMQQLNDIYSLFFLSVDTIALTSNIKFAGSATTPEAIGVVWIQPDEHWSMFDVLESLVHELTHNLLGFDNLVNKHYDKPSEIMNPNTWVPSAIRNQPRPVNGVAHSIIVGTELLNLRNRLNYDDSEVSVHGNSKELITKTKNAIDSFKSQRDSWQILSNRMQHLLNLADESLKHFAYGRIQDEIFPSRT